MRLPSPRGVLTAQLFAAMSARSDVPSAEQATTEEDRQLALWVLYEQHYRGFDDVDPRREWDPALLTVRAGLEEQFERSLRELAAPQVRAAEEAEDDLVAQLQHIVDADTTSLAGYLQRRATAEQYAEFLIHRSLYHLKESDPHAWMVPRLTGPAKVALAELQYDEFGAGVAANLHSHLFAEALEGAGLDSAYGAYVDVVPTTTLALNNAMSLFGLHRRLRGACAGHLAAFEMTSSLPCRRYSQGAARLGLDPRVQRYFDEHVVADAVHEHLAARDICGRLVDAEPRLHEDVLLGAAVSVQLEAAAGQEQMAAWAEGRTSLLPGQCEEVA